MSKASQLLKRINSINESKKTPLKPISESTVEGKGSLEEWKKLLEKEYDDVTYDDEDEPIYANAGDDICVGEYDTSTNKYKIFKTS